MECLGSNLVLVIELIQIVVVVTEEAKAKEIFKKRKQNEMAKAANRKAPPQAEPSQPTRPNQEPPQSSRPPSQPWQSQPSDPQPQPLQQSRPPQPQPLPTQPKGQPKSFGPPESSRPPQPQLLPTQPKGQPKSFGPPESSRPPQPQPLLTQPQGQPKSFHPPEPSRPPQPQPLLTQPQGQPKSFGPPESSRPPQAQPLLTQPQGQPKSFGPPESSRPPQQAQPLPMQASSHSSGAPPSKSTAPKSPGPAGVANPTPPKSAGQPAKATPKQSPFEPRPGPAQPFTPPPHLGETFCPGCACASEAESVFVAGRFATAILRQLPVWGAQVGQPLVVPLGLDGRLLFCDCLLVPIGSRSAGQAMPQMDQAAAWAAAMVTLDSAMSFLISDCFRGLALIGESDNLRNDTVRDRRETEERRVEQWKRSPATDVKTAKAEQQSEMAKTKMIQANAILDAAKVAFASSSGSQSAKKNAKGAAERILRELKSESEESSSSSSSKSPVQKKKKKQGRPAVDKKADKNKKGAKNVSKSRGRHR
ncbi:unnamed protein product [Symbiodinium sp. CCMP2592]|nr:unnamed protein product [Symbiodinium sp. CCMP2592]